LQDMERFDCSFEVMQMDGKQRKQMELSLQSCRCLSMLVKACFLFLHLLHQ
jgi:hypothetical protein